MQNDFPLVQWNAINVSSLDLNETFWNWWIMIMSNEMRDVKNLIDSWVIALNPILMNCQK